MTSLLERLNYGGPLGPFFASQLLKERESIHKSNKAPLGPELHSVVCFQNKAAIGLDDISNKAQREKGPVYVEGILSLVNRNWLSEGGQALLSKAIRTRVQSEETPGSIDFILQKPELNINVKVVGILFGEPVGLDTGLLRVVVWDKRTGQMNQFVVNSMHAYIYERSREYIAKHSLLKAVKEVINRCQSVPVQRRTPPWLVGEYINMYRERYENENAETRRIHRHVRRAEIYALLARHLEFISEMVKRDRLLNIQCWTKFKNRVELLFQQGSKEKWHDWDALEGEWGLDEDVETTNDGVVPNSREFEIEESTKNYENQDYSNTYRYVATRDASRSLSPDVTQSHYNDKNILSTVPSAFYTKEPLFPADFIWHCPDHNCPYAINFLDLQREDMEGLSRRDRNYLLSMDWSPSQEKFIELFHDIVELHYFKHIEDLGIRHVVNRYDGNDVHRRRLYKKQEISKPRQLLEDDIDFRFEWTKPNNHRPAFPYSG